MGEPAGRIDAHEQLRALPPHLVGEIVDGELIATPRPHPHHAKAYSTLLGDLETSFDHRSGGGRWPGGWWILGEPELRLGEDVFVPDVAGWRRGNLPRLPDEPYFTRAPDWVCEVISVATERLDRSRKKWSYLRAGVGHLWLVNPTAQTLEVYRRAGDFWQEIATWAGDESVRAEPFQDIEIDLSRWWDVGDRAG